MPAHESSGRDHPADQRIPGRALGPGLRPRPGVNGSAPRHRPVRGSDLHSMTVTSSAPTRPSVASSAGRGTNWSGNICKTFSRRRPRLLPNAFFPAPETAGRGGRSLHVAARAERRRLPFLVNARRRERNGRWENDCILVRMRQRNHFETELLTAKKAAENANKAKDQFLAALSHELRTPLSPVLMMSTAMEMDPAIPDDVREQAGHHSPQCGAGGAADRRSARPFAHSPWQARPRPDAGRHSPTAQRNGGDRAERGHEQARRDCLRKKSAEPFRLRRCRASAAGFLEHHQERREIHSFRRRGARHHEQSRRAN